MLKRSVWIVSLVLGACGTPPTSWHTAASADATQIRFEKTNIGVRLSEGELHCGRSSQMDYGNCLDIPIVILEMRNGDCLASNIVIPAGSDFLSYYAAGSSVPLSHPIADLSVIRRVKVAFAVRARSPDPRAGGHIESVLSSSVELRN